MHCQKCRQPLKLDASLEELNPAAYDLLISATAASSLSPAAAAPHEASPPAKQPQADAPASRHRHGSPKPSDSAMSFVYLTQSQVHRAQPQPAGLSPPEASSRSRPADAAAHHGGPLPPSPGGKTLASDEMTRVNRLFDILSARSDIDHPICLDCTDLLIDRFQRRLDAVSAERDAYVRHLRQLEAHQPTPDQLEARRLALAKAEEEKKAASKELKELELEKDRLDAEILALEEESRLLDRDEEAFWRDRNAFASRMADFQAERDSINSRYSNDSRLLDRLQRSNVYNDTFCISHDGSFATINGLRLGRLSNKPVDWPEINAAWGHALLLLVTVADKLGYSFHSYEPRPMGSTSTIVRYDASGPPAPKKQVLELYSSGDMPLGLTFMHRKLDNAMVAFLDLVRQLGLFVQRQTEASSHPLALPYHIEADRIGDVSIKLGIAQDDGWTKACKLTLTCCKFLLAHASNVAASPRLASGP